MDDGYDSYQIILEWGLQIKYENNIKMHFMFLGSHFQNIPSRWTVLQKKAVIALAVSASHLHG